MYISILDVGNIWKVSQHLAFLAFSVLLLMSHYYDPVVYCLMAYDLHEFLELSGCNCVRDILIKGPGWLKRTFSPCSKTFIDFLYYSKRLNLNPIRQKCATYHVRKSKFEHGMFAITVLLDPQDVRANSAKHCVQAQPDQSSLFANSIKYILLWRVSNYVSLYLWFCLPLSFYSILNNSS